jgi:hypothetical protein
MRSLHDLHKLNAEGGGDVPALPHVSALQPPVEF